MLLLLLISPAVCAAPAFPGVAIGSLLLLSVAGVVLQLLVLLLGLLRGPNHLPGTLLVASAFLYDAGYLALYEVLPVLQAAHQL